jgi:hypothetical protein
VITNVNCLPQPVPMVLTYADMNFADHYLLHIMLLADQPGIKVTVGAVR